MAARHSYEVARPPNSHSSRRSLVPSLVFKQMRLATARIKAPQRTRGRHACRLTAKSSAAKDEEDEDEEYDDDEDNEEKDEEEKEQQEQEDDEDGGGGVRLTSVGLSARRFWPPGHQGVAPQMSHSDLASRVGRTAVWLSGLLFASRRQMTSSGNQQHDSSNHC